MTNPINIRVISREEGMPYGREFRVIGWTGFDQAVVQDDDGLLLVLQPNDFEAASWCPITGNPCDCKDACLMPMSGNFKPVT